MTLPNTAAQTAAALRPWRDTLSRFIVLIERTLRPCGRSLRA